MKSKNAWFFISATAVFLLLIANIYVISLNRAYVRENRDLIIQNDSILSVNLSLTNELNKLKTNTFKASGKVTHSKSVLKKTG